MPANVDATAKQIHHPSGARFSVTRAISCVTSRSLLFGWTRCASSSSRMGSQYAMSGSHLRFRVPHLAEVRGPRARPELGEQAEPAVGARPLRDGAVRVVHVAEHDCVGRARLLAGRPDLEVADLAVLALRANLRALD